MTRTRAELSVVCADAAIPAGVQAERGWRCLAVAGPLDLSLSGVLAAIVVFLAQSGIAVFCVSTYDTDYVLVRGGELASAASCLRQAGHEVVGD